MGQKFLKKMDKLLRLVSCRNDYLFIFLKLKRAPPHISISYLWVTRQIGAKNTIIAS